MSAANEIADSRPKRPIVSTIVLGAGIVGFVLSFAIHLSSYAGWHLGDSPFLWILAPCVVVVMFLVGLRVNRAIPKTRRDFWPFLLGPLPYWAKSAGLVLITHGALSLLVAMPLKEKGQPAIMDGKMVLQEHGRVLRVLNEAEYRRQMALQTRILSEFWLFLYGVACLAQWAMIRRDCGWAITDVAGNGVAARIEGEHSDDE